MKHNSFTTTINITIVIITQGKFFQFQPQISASSQFRSKFN